MEGNNIDSELYSKHFRVAIFGSARIKKDEPAYNEIYELAKLIAAADIDIVTGGGPGIMNAACKGHHEGRRNNSTCAIGLNINIPKEQKPNRHLDIKKEFNRFSKRLDTFMLLSNAVVVAPGGVGTLLEFAYTWQLVQVKHICNIPIILLGKMWVEFLKWVVKYPLSKEFLDKRDFERLFFAHDYQDAFRIIKRFYDGYKQGDDICLNFKKYKLDYEEGRLH